MVTVSTMKLEKGKHNAMKVLKRRKRISVFANKFPFLYCFIQFMHKNKYLPGYQNTFIFPK